MKFTHVHEMDKRTFLKTTAASALGAPIYLSGLAELFAAARNTPPETLAADDHFWDEVRKGYRINPEFINLENGYYCIQPEATLEHFIEHIRQVNLEGSWYMRHTQRDNKARIAGRLADILGCSSEELVITRNTTEALDTVIGGFPWKQGDEAIMADQDYYAMRDMFSLVGDRYGVRPVEVTMINHPRSDSEIVELYENAITPRTRLLMVCHMINVTGQILPVRKICEMAHSRGVQVMVDGAHTFCHIDFRIGDLGCDYFGSSLHKWLSVPLGAGILYVRKDRIADLWPLFGDRCCANDNIRRLNHTGTHPVHTDLAIENAIDYHAWVGSKRKEERLRYLQRYWTDKVRNTPGVVLNTPSDPERSCAIANVGIEGMEPKDLARRLLEDYGIWTVAIDMANVRGCRITPNLYTSTTELDQLVAALKELAS